MMLQYKKQYIVPFMEFISLSFVDNITSSSTYDENTVIELNEHKINFN